MNTTLADYASAEIQIWENDSLLECSIAAQKLFKSISSSGPSPHEKEDWDILIDALSLPIENNEDAWHAVSTWNKLSGEGRYEYKNDRLTFTKIGVFAFSCQYILHRYGKNGILADIDFFTWKNRLCSAIQNYCK